MPFARANLFHGDSPLVHLELVPLSRHLQNALPEIKQERLLQITWMFDCVLYVQPSDFFKDVKGALIIT